MSGVSPADELVFLPLGGANEIGMNLSLYGFGPADDRRWLMIDLGVSFGGDGIPGVEVVMADPAFAVAQGDRLLGLVLTHAHEDHLGAVPYLWPRLRCPVYAGHFATAMLRRKIAEEPWRDEMPLRLLPDRGTLTIGPFDLELIGLTHSIPEMRAVAITTPLGLVLHTGDWKLDPDPVVGEASDETRLAELGDAGVLAMVCDSTNVFEPGHSGSEGSLLASLTEVVAARPGLVAVTCFGSNVARLHTLAAVAQATGRHVVMAGASLKRAHAAARECGFLQEFPPFLDDRAGSNLPRARVLVVCTGGQGEPNAALGRLASDSHPHLKLAPGDTVVFSTRDIPGNEMAIGRLHNRLLKLGCEIVTRRQALVHVSGHPARDELKRMYGLVRPRVSVPVHGEFRHLKAHADLALAEGVETALLVENGAVARLAPAPAPVADRVPSGRLSLEGRRTVPLDGTLVRERTKVIYNGAAVVCVAVDARGARDVRLSSFGLLEDGEDETRDRVIAWIEGALTALPAKALGDDAVVGETARLATRRAFHHLVHKKPTTHVHIIRLS